jgi:uncharacterized protein
MPLVIAIGWSVPMPGRDVRLWPERTATPTMIVMEISTGLDRAGLRILTRQECLALLASTNLGRIGISWQAIPMILPVHFTLDGERVVVATWDGSVVSRATHGTVVAFEVDHGCHDGCEAWSVLVNGIAEHIEPDIDANVGVFVDDHHPPRAVERWVPDGTVRLVSISTDQMSGRSTPDHDWGHSALSVDHDRS